MSPKHLVVHIGQWFHPNALIYANWTVRERKGEAK